MPEASLIPAAVARRLRDLGDLYRLAQSLGKARVPGPIADFPVTPRVIVPSPDVAEAPRK